MHERRLVEDLIRRAEVESGGAPVTRMVIRLGALSPVDGTALEHGIRDYASRVWGMAPVVEIELSEDAFDPRAQGVVLKSVGVESL